MAKSKFYLPGEDQALAGVIGTLSQTLPDERPITAISVVENSSKCPAGFFPILKTYDEDCDADLWRQPVIFGKKSCRYLCLSKSEDVSLFKMTALKVISIGDDLPRGFSDVTLTSDTKRPAWRRKKICCMLTNDPTVLNKKPLLTDIIVCSRLKKAPEGFQYAGEINGMLVCYKTSLDTVAAENNSLGFKRSVITNGEGDVNYENFINPNSSTPDATKRAPPARPPKETALVTELNKLNIQNNAKASNENINFVTNHDYEILDRSYGLQPTRSAPPIPAAPPVPPRATHNTKPPLTPAYSSYTLGSYNTLEGVKFVLNSKLGGFANSHIPMPVIKKKTLLDLNREYSYNFIAERQT